MRASGLRAAWGTVKLESEQDLRFGLANWMRTMCNQAEVRFADQDGRETSRFERVPQRIWLAPDERGEDGLKSSYRLDGRLHPRAGK